MNQRDWLERNPEHKDWIREYGKTWRREHPDYYQHDRRLSFRASARRANRREHFRALLEIYQAHKAAQHKRRDEEEQEILRRLRARRYAARVCGFT